MAWSRMSRWNHCMRSILACAALACGMTFASAAHAYDIDPLTHLPLPQIAADGRVAYTPIPREEVEYKGPYAPGTIVISTEERRLYYVLPGGRAMKYGVGVGRPGFSWGGINAISMKKEWPEWTPPAQMLRRRPDLPRHMAGGVDNPLGAPRTSRRRSDRRCPRAASA
jgi:lipoprotein-anchoring transpeptidase ErfK/SrfK